MLLLLIFSLLQACLYFYARNLALAAAQQGVRAARADQAQLPDGLAQARAFLTEAAGDSLLDSTVTASGSTATQIHIQVHGRALSVIPGTPGLPITQEATGTKERFTAGGAP